MAKQKRYIHKNTSSLKYELLKEEEKINKQYNATIPKRDDNEETVNSLEELNKKYQNMVKRIVSKTSPSKRIVLDGDEKAKHFIKNKDYSNLKSKEAEEKVLTNVEELFLEVNDSLFKQIITGKSENGKQLMVKTVNNAINYSANPTTANMSYTSVKDAVDRISQDNIPIVAFDLETYGGTSKHDNIWRPLGITEFSFQEYNTSYGQDFSKIQKNTAVVGIREDIADDLENRVLQAIKDGTIDNDEELKVTAGRMQKYGLSKIDFLDNGLSKMVTFPGEEAMIGGYNEDLIKKGFEKLKSVHKHATQNSTGGLLEYHKKLFEGINNLKDKTILSFNGMQFDMPILNSQMQKIMREEYGYGTVNANTKAIKEIFNIFGIDTSTSDNYLDWDINNLGISPKANQHFDISGIFRTANAIKGPGYMYGTNEEKMVKNQYLKYLNRQEHIAEAALPSHMDSALRHEAENDVTTLIKLALEKSEAYNNRTAIEHAMDALNEHYSNEGLVAEIESLNDKHVFMAKKGGFAPGRGVLGFSIDPTDKSIRTVNNYLINPNSKTEFMEKNKGVVNLGWNASANLKQGGLYKVGGIFSVTPDNPLLEKLTSTMPEYANTNLIAVNINSYLADHADKYETLNTSHYFFFTEMAQAEAFISNSLDLIGKESTRDIYDTGKGFTTARIPTGEKVVVERTGVKTKKVRSKKEWDEIKETIKNLPQEYKDQYYVKDLPEMEMQTKTITKTIKNAQLQLDENGKPIKEKKLIPMPKKKKDRPGNIDIKGATIYNAHPDAFYGQWVSTDKIGDLDKYSPYMFNEEEGTVFIPHLKEVEVNKKIDKIITKEIEFPSKPYYAPIIENGQFIEQTYKKELDKTIKVPVDEMGNPIDMATAQKVGEAKTIEFIGNGRDKLTLASLKDGRIYYNKRKPRHANMQRADGTWKWIEIDDQSMSIINDHVEYHSEKTLSERARSHFKNDTQKQARKFNNLVNKMSEQAKENKRTFAEELEIAKNIANKISRGEQLNNITEQENLGLELMSILGYKDRKVQADNLYSNTLNNFVRNAEKFYDLKEGLAELDKYVTNTLGLNGEAGKLKYSAMLDELLDIHATEYYNDKYLVDGQFHEGVQMSKHEIENIFEIDVSNFMNDRGKKLNSYSINNTVEASETLRINLKNPLSIIDEVTKLKFGNIKLQEKENSEAAAMIDLVNTFKRENRGYFEKSEKLQALVHNINNKDYKSAQYIATEFVNGLKEIKQVNPSYGLIRNTLGRKDILDDDFDPNFRSDFNKKGFDLKRLQAADKKTGQYISYTEKARDFDIKNIVDEWFMPSITKEIEGELITYTGDNALKEILKENHFGEQETKYFKLLWNKTRAAHTENIKKIHELIDTTNGRMSVINGELIAVYGDKAVVFDDLVKTEYNYGSLQHKVGSSYVTAHLNLEAYKTGQNVGFDFNSNIGMLTPNMEKYGYALKRAQREGVFRPEDLDLFRGKISKDIREDSIVSTFNVHELKGQWKIGFGKGLVDSLKLLVGTDGKKGQLGNVELIDKDAIDIIKEELERVTKNGKEFKNLTPQMKEAFGKNLIPILRSYAGTNTVVKEMLENVSFSGKDTDVAKDGFYLYFGDSRYSQRANDDFDNPQRPVLQAGKIDYRESDLKKGLKKYLNEVNENIENVKDKKDGLVGSVFEKIGDNRRAVVEGVGTVDSAITVKKANIGNLGFKAILDNHIEKVMKENTVENNIDEVSKLKLGLITKIRDSVNLFEQEKLMDSRLMDAAYERSADFQFISSKDLSSYYKDRFSYKEAIRIINSEKASPIEKRNAQKELDVLERLDDISMDFELTDDNKIVVKTKEGKIVRRGDKLMSYYDSFNPEGSVNSKIHIGRFEHAVYSKKGNIKLTDEEIEEFLNKNLPHELRTKNLEKNALSLLNEHFKVGYSVNDIRQQAYSKFTNDMVEKDMTYGLYQGLGSQNEKIAKLLDLHSYDSISTSILKNEVLKISEIEKIFKNVSIDNLKAAGFKNKEEFTKEVLDERHALSKIVFNEIDAFRDVSMIANHQVGKHQNQGMIADNIIASMFSAIKNTNDKSDKEAMSELINVLQNNNVLSDNMEVASDGRTIMIKAKQGTYKFDADMPLEDVRTLNLQGLKQAIKSDKRFKHLYHEKAGYIEDNEYKTMEAYGELGFYTTKYVNKDGATKQAKVAFSKGMSIVQQSIDPETMTTYDYRVVEGIKLQKQALKRKIDAEIEYKKTGNVENFKKTMDAVEIDYLIARDSISGLDGIAKPKTIGRQEMRIYDSKKWNEAAEITVQKLLENGEEDALKFRKEFIANSFNGVMEEVDGQYRLTQEYANQKVYGKYIKDLIKKTVYDPNSDIALNDEVLSLDRYKHLRTTVDIIKSTADKALGTQEVGLEYAERFHEAVSAHQAVLFNESTGNVTSEHMKSLGFKKLSLKEYGENLDILEGQLSTLGSAGEVIGLNTIYNTNSLVYLGEHFGSITDDNAYLAIPKAGKILDNAEINEIFQSEFKTLQQLHNELYEGTYPVGSKEHDNLKAQIEKKVKSIKTNLSNYAYNKEGAFHELGKTQIEESFRLKFSFMSNAYTVDDIGNGKIEAELIDSGNPILKRAKINGQSIYDLEKNGIFADYAFVSNDVFDRLGYYEDSKLATLGIRIKDAEDNLTDNISIIDADGEEKIFNLKDDRDELVKRMKENLRTNGIVANTGRYPMIMEDSEKATRIFLDDDNTTTTNNRARVSVATALSMNADNDGDSASFGVIKLASGNTYNDYLLKKQQAERALLNEGMTIDMPDFEQTLRERTSSLLNSEEDEKFFRGLNAHMGYNAIGINTYYNNKSIKEVHEEMKTAITNGTITEFMENLKHENLYKSILYANNATNPNSSVMKKNANILDGFVEKVNVLDKKFGIAEGILPDLKKIDIKGVGDDTGIEMAEYYDKYLGSLNKIKTSIDSGGKEAVMKEFKLDSKQADELIENFNANFDETQLERFRQHAVARSRWFDSFKETQAKSRKGSIGSINVGLQGIRAGAQAIYSDSDNIEDFRKYNIINQVAYELEEEVIGAKHGSVVNNITKARDISKLTQEFLSTQGKDDQELRAWLDDNLGNKAIDNIFSKLVSDNRISEEEVLNKYGNSTKGKREYLTNNYIQGLREISNSSKANNAMLLNRIGGNNGKSAYLNSFTTDINSLDSFTAAALNYTQYNDALTRETLDMADDVNIKVTGVSQDIIENAGKISSSLSNFKGNGLALGALSIGVGILASGFAGSPVSQHGANELAQQEEAQRSNDSNVPTLMDGGATVTQNSSRGYIINVKANSNKDMKQTRKALKSAASASAGGGVNVNMTIKDTRKRFTDDDFEEWVTGL